jgi:predicted transcriptional regulator
VPQKPVTVNFVTDAQMREALHVAARAEDRSMSWVIRKAVNAYLAKPFRDQRAPRRQSEEAASA